MGEKALWDAAHVKLLCDLCKVEVLAGRRPLGHLNKTAWKNVEARFEEESGKKLQHLQLKNKWDNLKISYSIFMELKNCATGLGWNEIRQTVDCDDKWWEEHLAVSLTMLDHILVLLLIYCQYLSCVFDCSDAMILVIKGNAHMCNSENVVQLTLTRCT